MSASGGWPLCFSMRKGGTQLGHSRWGSLLGLNRCWVQDERSIFVPKDSSVRFQERDSWCKSAAPADFSYFVWLLAEAAPANLFLQALGTGFNRQCLLVIIFSRAQIISCLFAVKGVTWGFPRELDSRHTSEHNLEGPGAIWGYRQLIHPHDNEGLFHHPQNFWNSWQSLPSLWLLSQPFS